jgi:hypothetical protein
MTNSDNALEEVTNEQLESAGFRLYMRLDAVAVEIGKWQNEFNNLRTQLEAITAELKQREEKPDD